MSSKNLYPTELLIKDLKEDKHTAWRYVYTEYRPMIIRMVKKNSGTEDEAVDLYQNVMIALQSNLQKDKVHLDSDLKNYIYTLASNQWRYALRKRGNTISSNENEFLLDVLSEEEENAIAYEAELDGILIALQDKCRDLILAKYSSEKKTMDHIAIMFGFKDARSATSQLNKCMEKARDLAKTTLLKYS